MGEQHYHDSKINVRIQELPAQLRPNINGLTKDQFKVYKDFSKLSYKSKFDHVNTQVGFDNSDNAANGQVA